MTKKLSSNPYYRTVGDITEILEHRSGNEWEVSAFRVTKSGCTPLGSKTLTEKAILHEIQKGERTISFKVNGHSVRFETVRVERKIKEKREERLKLRKKKKKK